MTAPVHVSVIGGGSWGTTVASLAARNRPTLLWARNAQVVEEVNASHTNSRYLSDLPLCSRLAATASLEEAVASADVLVVAIPSHSFRGMLQKLAPHLRPWVPVISVSKGLEPGTEKRMTQIIDEELPDHPAGLLAGPNLAREILQGMAAAAVIAMRDEQLAKALQPIFNNSVFRVYTNTDVTGCELGGPLKNVIAIACGMADGLGVGLNTQALVISRGLAELTRFGVAMGGQAQTFAGLTGLGDLIATCMSPLSRNHQVGEKLAQGMSIDDVVGSMNMVAEGVKTSPVVVEIAHRIGVTMPISEEVAAVVQGQRTPDQAFRGLLRLTAGAESDAA
ncbi:MAG: NAD(P)H-dependent glycerol-3-phosphate dehydrogenase [Sinobacteraceae bacterium]|nr:NAD(P)H-dependent glycerol-3-phosphate dehydrogenase [Nevskiaceae bacterium]